MSSYYDSLTGESSRPERKAPSNSWGTRSQRRETRPAVNVPRPSAQRPAEVSEMVWGLAEQWLEQGTATFGSRPPVNLPEFSKRLSERVNDGGFTGSSPEEVNDLVAVMIRKFWDTLEVGDRNSGVVQFGFLRDDWEGLLDQAKTSVRVKYLKEHGVPVGPPEYPSKGENAYERVIAKQKLDRILADTSEPPPPRTGSVRMPRKRNP